MNMTSVKHETELKHKSDVVLCLGLRRPNLEPAARTCVRLIIQK